MVALPSCYQKNVTNATERTLITLARKAARGIANYTITQHDGAERHIAMTNDMIRQYWGIPKVAEELQTQRFKWWQSLVKFQEDSAPVMAAFFGIC